MRDETNPYASPIGDDEGAPPADAPPRVRGDARRDLYRPTAGLGRWLRTFFGLLIVGDVLGIAAAGWYLGTAADTWDQADFSPAEIAELTVALALVVVYLVLVVLYCRWKYRSYKNLSAFGEQEPRFSPGWAVGFYFVPIANLFQPFRAMKDLVNGSRGDYVEQPSGLVSGWWAAFLIMGVLERGSTRAAIRAETLLELQFATVVGMIASLVSIVAALLAMRLVGLVDRRQQQRAVALGWDRSEEPPIFGADLSR